MTSTASVYRTTGRMIQDETSGLEVPEWSTTLTDSPFRLGGANTGSSGTVTVSGCPGCAARNASAASRANAARSPSATRNGVSTSAESSRASKARAFAAYVAWSYVSVLWADDQGVAWEGSHRTLLYFACFALSAAILQL
mgnify:CR=1 FL=1